MDYNDGQDGHCCSQLLFPLTLSITNEAIRENAVATYLTKSILRFCIACQEAIYITCLETYRVCRADFFDRYVNDWFGEHDYI